MVATKYIGCVSTVVGVTSRCDVADVREIMVAMKYMPGLCQQCRCVSVWLYIRVGVLSERLW